MNDDTPLDMLQIKIERARDALPKETKKAIDSVDWRAYILSLREKKGYSFEQLEDLELETELLLCGLLLPENYPEELEERLKLPRSQVDLLVSEMNEFVFKKIKEELIKNSQRESVFIKKEEIKPIQTQNFSSVVKVDTHISSPNVINTKETNIEVMPEELTGDIVKTNLDVKEPSLRYSPKTIPEKEKPTQSISFQKLSGSFQLPTMKTEYSLDHLSKGESKLGGTPTSSNSTIKISKTDPYRIDPNE